MLLVWVKKSHFVSQPTQYITFQRKHDTTIQQIEQIQHTVRKVQIAGKKWHTNWRWQRLHFLRLRNTFMYDNLTDIMILYTCNRWTKNSGFSPTGRARNYSKLVDLRPTASDLLKRICRTALYSLQKSSLSSKLFEHYPLLLTLRLSYCFHKRGRNFLTRLDCIFGNLFVALGPKHGDSIPSKFIASSHFFHLTWFELLWWF